MKYRWVGNKIRHAPEAVGYPHKTWGWDPSQTQGFLANGDIHCKCGYHVCGKTGPCLPLAGWSGPHELQGAECYQHSSGSQVWVWGEDKPYLRSRGWGFSHGQDESAAGYRPTKEEAMLAALAPSED